MVLTKVQGYPHCPGLGDRWRWPGEPPGSHKPGHSRYEPPTTEAAGCWGQAGDQGTVSSAGGTSFLPPIWIVATLPREMPTLGMI